MSDSDLAKSLELLHQKLDRGPTSEVCSARMDGVAAQIKALSQMTENHMATMRQFVNDQVGDINLRMEKLERVIDAKLSNGWPSRTLRLEEKVSVMEQTHKTWTERWTRIMAGLTVLLIGAALLSIAAAAWRGFPHP